MQAMIRIGKALGKEFFYWGQLGESRIIVDTRLQRSFLEERGGWSR